MKKVLTIFVFILAIAACKEEVFDIENLSDNKVFVVGHGGAGFISPTNNIPENSMKSLELTIEGYNADGIEVDVQLSKDSQLVLYHDDFLRTKTGCRQGRINNYNWEEIKNCRYKKDYFGSISVDERLALLEEPLAKFSRRKIKPQVHLDIRYNNFDSSQMSREKFYDIFSRKILDLIEKYNAEDWVFCGTGDPVLLKLLYKRNPRVKLFYEGYGIDDMLQLKSELDYFGIVVSNDNISKEDVELAHANGLRVAIFNLRALPANKEGLRKSPDYLITDNVTLLQDILH